MSLTHSTEHPLHIAIVGGGPGGLTLASILHRRSLVGEKGDKLVTFTVFELDSSRASRTQGGMLDIHKGSGQLALESAGLLETFKSHMRVDATEFYLRGKDGKMVFHDTEEVKEDGKPKNTNPERPEIDRAVLRSILLDCLPLNTVQWGKKLVAVTTLPSPSELGAQKFELSFADGTVAGGFDIVIGADGTWSKVRSSFTTPASDGTDPSKPPFSGIICVESIIPKAASRYPNLTQYVGKGTCFTLGQGIGLFSQLNGDSALRSYALFPGKEDWNLQSTESAEQKEEFTNQYFPPSDWCHVVRNMIFLGDGALSIRPLYEYAPGHEWTSSTVGVTLLGDAAHVMTPFAGVGVNLALHDAHDLACAIEKIVANGVSISQALREYETTLFERSTQNVTFTRQMREVCLYGGPEKLSAVMKGMGQEVA